MSDKKIVQIVAPARRGSKRGWRNVSSELPPADYARLETIMARTGKRRTDLVAEAIRLFLEHQAA